MKSMPFTLCSWSNAVANLPIAANRRTLRFARPSRTLTILLCPLIPSGCMSIYVSHMHISDVSDYLTRWFIGIIITIVMSSFNHVMSLRCTYFESLFRNSFILTSTLGPSVGISPLVVQLIALPIGKLFEWVLPTTKFNTLGYQWSFNPGPFNIKEHTVITVMANLLYNDAYATLITAIQELFYGQKLTYGYRILIVLSTQLFGYTYAGLVRQFLVWPSSMIWPGALVECALLNTLHKNYGKFERNHMSRERFFFLVTIGAFVYYFLPGYIFTGLSMFTWACWIAPQNQTVNSLFGFQTGLGMGFLTFDWSMISYLASPLIAPVRIPLCGIGSGTDRSIVVV